MNNQISNPKTATPTGIYLNDKFLMDENEEIKLKGKHNLNNIMFILAVSEILNLDLNKTIQSIKEFKGLEHRLEYVGVVDDVIYYNDSISTFSFSLTITDNSANDADSSYCSLVILTAPLKKAPSAPVISNRAETSFTVTPSSS